MDNKKRLLVDIDGTLSKFHDEVHFLERMFEKGFFENLKPFENMVEAIKLFKKRNPDIEVFVCSAIVDSKYCIKEKNIWLDKYLPEIDEKHRIFTQMGKSKADYLPGGASKNDYLLDDYNKGLRLFKQDNGISIKCRNNINHKGLGAYGGETGNLWVGPMVNTQDHPEMIVCGLCRYMNLSYDLSKVLSVYNITNLSSNDIDKLEAGLYIKKENSGYIGISIIDNNVNSLRFSDPFNCISWLLGNEKSKEIEINEGISFKSDFGNVGIGLKEEMLENILSNMGLKASINEFLNYHTLADIEKIKNIIEESFRDIYKRNSLDDQIKSADSEKNFLNNKIVNIEKER